MKRCSRLLALLLSLTMMLIAIPLGSITASALVGEGAPTNLNYYAKGVDISFWQAGDSTGKNVDFAKLKASGCQFVILRLGYGQSIDKAFVSFYNKARAAGMPLGVYLYGLKTTKSGAISDANWAISIFEQYGMYFEYPIFYDIEEKSQLALSSANATALCEGWCETLRAKNYYPGIYSGISFYNKLYSSFKQSNDLWIAHVKSGAGSEWSSQYTYNSKNYNAQGYSMWQYSWSNIYNGSYIYNGIYKSGTTKVEALDLDVCYKDYPSIMSENGYNNCPINSSAKRELNALVTEAENARAYNYSSAQLTNLRHAYNNAKAVLASSSSNEESYVSAVNTLKSALYPPFNIISKGKSYTTNATGRTDGWKDNGVKLTDGVKGTLDGGSNKYTYSGWGDGTGAQVVIDLGASHDNHNGYRVYASGCSDWGISTVTNIQVSVSNDGTNFTPVASSYKTTPIGISGTWNTYYITAWASSLRSERYVKISVATEGNHTWIEEVEVASGEAALKNVFFIDGINKYIYSGDCNIYTPSFGTITTSTANHSYCNSVVGKLDTNTGKYVITKKINGIGPDTESVTLASDEIFIAAHGWEGGTISDPIVGSMANYNAVGALNVGDSIYISGVDFNNKTIHVATCGEYNESASGNHVHTSGGWVVVTEPKVGVEGLREQRCTTCGEIINQAKIPALTEGDVQKPEEKPDNAKTFWVTHVNDSSVEGAGVITTTSDANIINAWAWRLIVVFKPVSGLSGVYEISRIYDHLGLAAEDATVIAAHANSSIPAGGFIYHVNYGNDYIALGQGDTDYTSPNCTNAIEDAKTWKVGDKFQFYGISPATPLVSTTTPTAKWYEDAYVCNSFYAPYSPEPEKPDVPDVPDVPETKKYLLGDINMDGTIDQYDYIMAKRAHFNTIEFDANENILADVNEDNSVDQYDYILIKRIHFKNYTLEKYVDIEI